MPLYRSPTDPQMILDLLEQLMRAEEDGKELVFWECVKEVIQELTQHVEVSEEKEEEEEKRKMKEMVKQTISQMMSKMVRDLTDKSVQKKEPSLFLILSAEPNSRIPA